MRAHGVGREHTQHHAPQFPLHVSQIQQRCSNAHDLSAYVFAGFKAHLTAAEVGFVPGRLAVGARFAAPLAALLFLAGGLVWDSLSH